MVANDFFDIVEESFTYQALCLCKPFKQHELDIAKIAF